jgi:hypothetical protein
LAKNEIIPKPNASLYGGFFQRPSLLCGAPKMSTAFATTRLKATRFENIFYIYAENERRFLAGACQSR